MGSQATSRERQAPKPKKAAGQEMNLLLDTTIMIDVVRFRNQRNEFLAELVRSRHRLSTSTLNIAELFAGVRPGETARIEALLSGLELYELSASIARLAGQMRNTWAKKGRTLSLADTIVAATAIDRGCALLTDNRKDFPMREVQLFPLP
jgi:predicted nucleic acid-binding protein